MKSQGLRTCIYKVGDITRAKKWYTKIFETEPYFDEPFYVGFNVGGYELGLQPDEGELVKKAENVLCYWDVQDVQKTMNQLIMEGALLHEKATDVGGGVVVGSVRDPWDNVIGLICNPEFGKTAGH